MGDSFVNPFITTYQVPQFTPMQSIMTPLSSPIHSQPGYNEYYTTSQSLETSDVAFIAYPQLNPHSSYDSFLNYLKSDSWERITSLNDTVKFELDGHLHFRDVINVTDKNREVFGTIDANTKMSVKLKNELRKYLIEQGIHTDYYNTAFLAILNIHKTRNLTATDVETATMLINEYKVNPNLVTENNDNILHIICKYYDYNYDIIRDHIATLIGLMDVTQRNNDNKTPLDILFSKKDRHPRFIQKLLKASTGVIENKPINSNNSNDSVNSINSSKETTPSDDIVILKNELREMRRDLNNVNNSLSCTVKQLDNNNYSTIKAVIVTGIFTFLTFYFIKR